ncbi:MAG: hypothetical protein M0P13_11900 [Fibrobacteraceae bacterium]|nr:hypothetical protein [Fibrobacteraceae bacterium]
MTLDVSFDTKAEDELSFMLDEDTTEEEDIPGRFISEEELERTSPEESEIPLDEETFKQLEELLSEETAEDEESSTAIGELPLSSLQDIKLKTAKEQRKNFKNCIEDLVTKKYICLKDKALIFAK